MSESKKRDAGKLQVAAQPSKEDVMAKQQAALVEANRKAELQLMADLQAPFTPDEIEWRVQRSGKRANGEQWAMVLAYVANRAIMDRLDRVFGATGWFNQFKEGPGGGVLCGISAMIEAGKAITKWDGAENTQIESVKGGLSGSMKRAAVQWGMGRYLYNLEATFVTVSPAKSGGSNYINDSKTGVKGYWADPELPAWAKPAATKASGNGDAGLDF